MFYSTWKIQSNSYIRDAITSSALITKNDIPGHPLLPAPKGIYWKSFPLKPKELLFSVQESLRTKSLYFFPINWVSLDHPSIDNYSCSCSDDNSIYIDIFQRLLKDQQRAWRAQLKCFLNNNFKRCQFLQIILTQPTWPRTKRKSNNKFQYLSPFKFHL